MYFMSRLYHRFDLLDTVSCGFRVPEIHVVLGIPTEAEGVDDLTGAGVDHVPDHSFPTCSGGTVCFVQGVFVCHGCIIPQI